MTQGHHLFIYGPLPANRGGEGHQEHSNPAAAPSLSLYIYIYPPRHQRNGAVVIYIGRPNTLARLLRDCRRKTQSTPRHSQNLTSLPPRLLLALRPPSAWQPPPPTEGQERRGRARPTPGGSAPIACPSVSGEPAFGPPSASAVARERRPEMRRRNGSKTERERERETERAMCDIYYQQHPRRQTQAFAFSALDLDYMVYSSCAFKLHREC